ncbi:ATP-binding protein [uncultured Fibrella sp.]|uniref:ATP-binding protein n=1 Tax=uncultured Fibrella sp. TaxID=1284596 RepID=UPI0035CB5FF7
MNELDQQVARRLTRFYLIALTVIAVLSVSGLLFIRRTISTHYDDSRVVNVAGRQRMLSQRLTKLAVLRTTGLRAADTVSFDSLVQSWGQTHIQLRNGTLRMEKGYTVRKSARLDSMFTRIEPYFQSTYRSFGLINNPRSTGSEKQRALEVILKNEFPFLQQMNNIVFQFDTESFQQVQTLERIEWLLAIATLLTLVVEGFFIFRPVVNYTRLIIRRLYSSEQALQLANSQLGIANQELETTNQELAESNRKLIDTQAELLRATEEKYQLQLSEETVRSAALLEGQEEERKRFARELHDGIGQMLTGLKLHAEKLKSTAVLDEKQRLRFAELCDLIYDVIQTTRQISYNLMPSSLSDFGLGATLGLLVDQTARSSGIDVVFDGDRDGMRLSPSIETGLYRIAQEALHNAIKYAGARQIKVVLRQTSRKLILTVADNGKGFDAETVSQSAGRVRTNNGIANMETRARLLNGELRIESAPGKGTQVKVSIHVARK